MMRIRVAVLASILAAAVAGTSVTSYAADQPAAKSDTMKKPTKKKMAHKAHKAKKAKKKMAAPAKS